MDHFTDNLMHYPLPNELASTLRQSDVVAQQFARAGRYVPARIALSPAEFDVVDRIVRSCSHGRFTARSVQWNGRGLDRVHATVSSRAFHTLGRSAA